VSGRAELFLAIIAFATLATAVVQIGVLVAAGLAARRLLQLTERVEREMKPIFGHLDAIGRDAARATSLAAEQVERADRLLGDVANRVEETMGAVQKAVNAPAREMSALMVGVRAALDVLRQTRQNRPRGRGDDEDALFI
jgi:hypothetical protein